MLFSECKIGMILKSIGNSFYEYEIIELDSYKESMTVKCVSKTAPIYSNQNPLGFNLSNNPCKIFTDDI